MFLFSILMIVAGLVAAGWLLATGQAGTVDGLFLFLTALLLALCFALYALFVVRRALETASKQAVQPAKAGPSAEAAKPAPAAVGQP